MVRSFYIAVKIVTDKLSEEQGFDSHDRLVHLQTLINFTDFSQLRLILIIIQFMNFKSVQYLKTNAEFNEVLNEVGLNYNSW